MNPTGDGPRPEDIGVVAVASANPAKTAAVRDAFALFGQAPSIVRAPVDGGPEQPIGDQQTREGAERRVRQLRATCPDARWWIGIEGGVEDVGRDLMVSAWAVVAHGDRESHSRSATFSLPPSIAAKVRAGTPLGEVTQALSIDENWQQSGLLGVLSGGLLSRAELYVQPIALALIPLFSPWQRITEAELGT
ncbi:MAG TPA: inosine/xanthosine triphosphatase [Pseudonocardiaceae bacterium]|jgi:inosine/xanthosine triphosphatase|nr:inosine/xanthosine triphosphatase [Pseudonocardiaceae bacterium]